jgi:hypothetical protein
MVITNYITQCVKDNKPIIFLKFGDGEYNCVFNNYGANCDNDTYTPKLSFDIKKSFKYIVEKTDKTYIGMWQDIKNTKQWEELVNKKVNWVNYHAIIIDNKNNQDNQDKLDLYKAIKNNKSKKIIVCNELLIKSKYLFDADHIVIVPFNNWFDNQFNEILNQIIQLIGNDDNHIVITCCGMSAKVLIPALREKFTNGIYLDFGSALDFICTKKDSRGYEPVYNITYEYLIDFFKEILPEDWNDEKYNYIYEKAKNKLGIHLK